MSYLEEHEDEPDSPNRVKWSESRRWRATVMSESTWESLLVPKGRYIDAVQALARSVIDLSVNIPQRVFAADFEDVFVMDFEWLVDRRAIGLVKMLMTYEGSAAVVISKLAELDEKIVAFDEDVFMVAASADDESYSSFVRRNWREASQKSPSPAIRRPWAVFAKRIAACSECGSWCIYGDKYAEIALLAFKGTANIFLTKRLESEFRCVRLRYAFAHHWLGLGKHKSEHAIQYYAALKRSYMQELNT